MAGERSYPPHLDEWAQSNVTSEIVMWSMSNGLAFVPAIHHEPPDSGQHSALLTPAPVTLWPSRFPKYCFQEGRAIQSAYNGLYAAIANDEEWLGAIMKDLSKADDFIASLWDIHKVIKKEGFVQDISLGIFRSDYMIHKLGDGRQTIRQVEFNTIASSFGGLSAKVSSLHHHLVGLNTYGLHDSSVLPSIDLPTNPSIERIATGLIAAHEAYGPCRTTTKLRKCILMIVQEDERNLLDQYALLNHIQVTSGVPVFRLPFKNVIMQTGIPDELPARPLVFRALHARNSPYEVSVVYFRAGYTPAEYDVFSGWSIRHHIERSAAIKCPSILTHLAGSKKIQQVLATPNSTHLERFLVGTTHETYIPRIRSTFAAMYPLDSSPEGQRGIEIATNGARAVDYVLKPQREGGGNNIYGEQIPAFLRSLGSETSRYGGHILMELIKPPVMSNTIFREGKVVMADKEVICELGVFGTCLWKAGGENRKEMDMLMNEEAGFLLRTKAKESNEGGVAAGFGSIDSPCLVDEVKDGLL